MRAHWVAAGSVVLGCCWASLVQAQDAPTGAVIPAPDVAAGAVFTPSLHFSVTAGQLGAEPLYSLHLGYQPSRRLGFEATIAHNPSSGTHAALHHIGAVVPVLGNRHLRPFLVAGLGTIQVFPGTSINAETVTKLVLHAGGGAQIHLRDDIALRLEARTLGAVDQQDDHSGLLGYTQWSAGLAFHRPLGASSASDRGEEP